MGTEFSSIEWDADTERDCRWMLHRARDEDLGSEGDWTSHATSLSETACSAAIVAREALCVCGVRALTLINEVFESHLEIKVWQPDGSWTEPGERVIELQGTAHELLVVERTLLNLLAHLSGIATLTYRYRQQVEGTAAAIYDTRKTLPGWRRLQKYAVRCGGGTNHRFGLYDGILIKDNHLAVVQKESETDSAESTAEALRRVRAFAASRGVADKWSEQMPIEIEVDHLEQLQAVIELRPDIVLLDNMRPGELRRAVALRDRIAPDVILEASGGVNLKTVGAIARTGVDRISVGALTHSARAVDLALDWR